MNMESAEWMARAEREYDAALDMYKMDYHRFALMHAQLSLVYALRAVAIDKGLSPHETIDLTGIALLIESPEEISQIIEEIKRECALIVKGQYWQDPDREKVRILLDRAGEVLEWAENVFDNSCWSEKE
ncbi:MAG: HEPN domain-containing protein [Methanomassiliicoccales archaeon]|jgi:HEPN domain-containing protein